MFRSNNQDKNNNILVKISAQTSYYLKSVQPETGVATLSQLGNCITNGSEPSSDRFLQQRWTMELKNQIFCK